MSERTLLLNKENFPLVQPVGGITFEYDPADRPGDDAERARFDSVVSGLVYALDAYLRNVPALTALQEQADEIAQDAEREAGIEPQPHPKLQYESEHFGRLQWWGVNVAKKLQHPGGRFSTMSAHTGELSKGHNILGDPAVNAEFAYESPQRPSGVGSGGTHWYGTSFNMVKSDSNLLTGGVYNREGLIIDPEGMAEVLSDPVLHRMIGGDPGIRVSETQPTWLAAAKYRLEGRRHNGSYPNVVPVPGIAEFLQQQVEGPDAMFSEYVAPEVHGYRSAGDVVMAVTNEAANIGVKFSVLADGMGYTPRLDAAYDADAQTVRFLDGDGQPSTSDLNSFAVEVSPVSLSGHFWSPLDTRLDIFQSPDRVEQADAVNLVVNGIRNRLLGVA